MKVIDIRRDSLVAQKANLDELRKREVELLAKGQELLDSLVGTEEAQVFLQKVAQDLQKTLKFRLQDVVDTALDAVLPGQYAFTINFEVRAGRSEADLKLTDLKTGAERDPFDSNGGGLSDIIAFCVRIATLLIAKKRKIIVMDEAMKFVSPSMKEAAYQILNSLVRKMGFQVIANTHDVEEMRAIADREFKFSRVFEKVDGVEVGVTKVVIA